jgi:hypothetical protein
MVIDGDEKNPWTTIPPRSRRWNTMGSSMAMRKTIIPLLNVHGLILTGFFLFFISPTVRFY